MVGRGSRRGGHKALESRVVQKGVPVVSRAAIIRTALLGTVLFRSSIVGTNPRRLAVQPAAQAHAHAPIRLRSARAIRAVAPTNLRICGPSFAAMRRCLAIQAAAPPRRRAAVFFGRSPLERGARRVYSGALGEVVVAHVLDQLGSEWTVLNAVPVTPGEPEVDHVLIGPAGVFTLQIKYHSGEKIWVAGSTFLVNGEKHDHLRRSSHEATRAGKLLSAVTGRPIPVTPIIVVVNPISITVGRKPSKVVVLSSHNLKQWLLKKSRTLSDRAVRHFSIFAEERSTWAGASRIDAGQAVAALDCLNEFERLRKTVDAARRRARLWIVILVSLIPLSIPVLALTGYHLVGVALQAP